MNETTLSNAANGLVDWHSYARCYDLLCEMNPAYADLISHFQGFLTQRISPFARILDLGAGTGNFVLAGAQVVPSAQWTHLDADDAMNAIASRKYHLAGHNVHIVQQKSERATFAPGSFELIISINAMYAMPDPQHILRSLRNWLAPGGLLYLVDLGRIQNTLDWTRFLVLKNAKRLGVLKTLSILLNEGQVISSQNRRIAKLQRAGVYWKHSGDELNSALKRSGFVVEMIEKCYRGYSDRAIARPIPAERQVVHDDPEDRLDVDSSSLASRVNYARPSRDGETNLFR